MEKKFGLIILIVILFLAIFGFMFFNQYNNAENQIKVGNTLFNLPEGFHQGTANKANDINVTNGYDTLFFKECGDSNITKYIKEYKNYKHEENNTTIDNINNFTVKNIVVYKSTVVNESSSIHYWFDYNNKTYSIYTWSANGNCDSIVKDIVNNLN